MWLDFVVGFARCDVLGRDTIFLGSKSVSICWLRDVPIEALRRYIAGLSHTPFDAEIPDCLQEDTPISQVEL